jgi:hypothetical protein
VPRRIQIHLNIDFAPSRKMHSGGILPGIALGGQNLPIVGIFCRSGAANISTLKKTSRAFIGKIWVKKRA